MPDDVSKFKSDPTCKPPLRVSLPVVDCAVSLSKNWLAVYPPNVLAPLVAPVNCAPVNVVELIRFSPGTMLVKPLIGVCGVNAGVSLLKIAIALLLI